MFMDKFFHYTSVKSLFGIISNQELWFSNLKNSNDPNEMYLTCEDYNQYLNNMNVNPYHGTPIILDKNRLMGCPYGVSFTTLEDDLSQWERYGDNRSGVCIVFDIEFIQRYLEENYQFNFYFEPMKYTEKEKITLISENISKMPDYKNYKWETHWPFCALYYLIHYSEARALFKDEGFAKEKEFRLFFDPIEYKFYYDTLCLFQGSNVESIKKSYQYTEDIIHFLVQDKKYALMRNGINSYFKLDLNLFGKDKVNLIKEIILGPNCNQDEEELKGFLSKHGYNPEVRKSKIKIRQ